MENFSLLNNSLIIPLFSAEVEQRDPKMRERMRV